MTTKTRVSRATWMQIRDLYTAGGGSLRVLSERFDVPLRTLERHSAREGWRRRGGELAAVAANSAVEAAREKGRKAGLDAAALIERTLTEAQGFLDSVQELAARKPLNSDELQRIVNSWRTTVQEARRALGLDRDEHAYAGILRLDVLSRSFGFSDEPVLVALDAGGTAEATVAGR